MRMARITIGILVVAAMLIAVVLTFRRGPLLPEVPPGDREIAWIHASTSVSAWERFVAGVIRISRDWSDVTVDDSAAFLEESTAVPEVVVSLRGVPGRIRIRWYKLSKDANADAWAARLSRRAPLAVIGGGSSDRAFDLAQAMAKQQTWNAEPPLLFFTTATASTISDPDQAAPVNLMNVYSGRSFRMCFTNEQIARAVIDFVWSQPDLRPIGDPMPALSAVSLAAGPSVLDALPLLIQHGEHGTPTVSALEWDDDPYSVDLSRQFHSVFHEAAGGRVLVRETRGIPFSVGGQFSPNKWEAQAAQLLVQGFTYSPMERQLLVLPTVAAPARRVLRSITGALPLVGRNLVALTGDSINLNNVYRDADIGWDVRMLAVPLVFFAHQNPVAWDTPAPEEDPSWPAERSAPNEPTAAASDPFLLEPPTNTDELLQHRDMMRLIIEAVYGIVTPGAPAQTPTASAEELARRLRSRTPSFFGSTGDRIAGRGEYVICLRPKFLPSGQVLSEATLEIWTRGDDSAAEPGTERGRWHPVKRLNLNHDREPRATH